MEIEKLSAEFAAELYKKKSIGYAEFSASILDFAEKIKEIVKESDYWLSKDL